MLFYPGRDGGYVGCLFLFGVHGFLQRNAQFFTYRLELMEVFFVLALVLDLVFDAYM